MTPKWIGKIVKAHPSYSGTILTATYQISRDIGWGFFEKLAQQKIMQVQSASDPPKKLALGERSIMADGIEYGMFRLKETGKPVELIYPTEGTPLIVGPNAVFKAAPNPNAARLIQSYMLSAECQQLVINEGGLRSAHKLTKDKARSQAAVRDQTDEGRRRGGREEQRRDQGALHQDIQDLRPRMHTGFSRRDLLKGSGALALGLSATRVLAAAPPAATVTPELIAAAKNEGKVLYYTSIDLPMAEKIAKSFEAKYPGIAVRVERTGAERVFQRIAQEYASRIHAVDVVNSSDAAHFIVWKRRACSHRLCPRMSPSSIRPITRSTDGLYASFRIGLSIIAYNTNLVKPEEAPKSFADLLDPKWKGKLVKAHPGYSGTIMTATYQMQRDLGWGYFEKLAQQNVMQVQSASDPPKKLALGERAVQADGNEYNLFQLKEKRPAGRAGLCDRRNAADRRSQRRLQECAKSQRGASVPELLLQRRSASSSSSMSAACARCIRKRRRDPAASPSRRSRP